MKDQTTARLKGVIIPVQWNELGSPTAIALFTYDEKVFQIDIDQGVGNRMFAHLNRAVSLSYQPCGNDGTEGNIVVHDFSVFKNDI